MHFFDNYASLDVQQQEFLEISLLARIRETGFSLKKYHKHLTCFVYVHLFIIVSYLLTSRLQYYFNKQWCKQK